MIRILIVCFIMSLSLFGIEGEVIIEVPSEMMIELVVADETGLLNGVYDVRVRLYLADRYNELHNSDYDGTGERLWFQDFGNLTIANGAMMLAVNQLDEIISDNFYRDDILLVVSVGSNTIEIPLLTDFYSYRSESSEFGYDTRFHNVFYIDRDNEYLGFGTSSPEVQVDVNGSIRIGYEITELDGAIRYVDDTLKFKRGDTWIDLLYSDELFDKSKWSQYPNSIQLTTADYKVGISTYIPEVEFHIIGNGYVSGNFKSNTVSADAYYINQFSLDSSDMVVSKIDLIDAYDKMYWSTDNVLVSYGILSGDASNLTNVGVLSSGFQSSFIVHNHIEYDSIESDNLGVRIINNDHILMHR